MASELEKLTEELKKYGLDLADVLRGTHTQTVMVATSIMNEMLEVALRLKLLAEKKPVNDRMFKGNGALATLEKRINAAHQLKLMDDATSKDAHLVRRIRNKFAHEKEKMHFDSGKTVDLVKQLSTYEAATSNQVAFWKATGIVIEQVAKVKALREQPAQTEPKTS